MSVGRQFGLAATGGDPKLKLPLVAAVPIVGARKAVASEAFAAKPPVDKAKAKRARKRKA